MKKILTILRILTYGILVLIFGILCAFYTHPVYMKQQSASFFPQLKEHHFFTKQKDTCQEFESTAHKLNDQYRDYIWNSAYQKFGDCIIQTEEIRPLYQNKKLFLIDSSDKLALDTLFHSFAFLTKDAKDLLHEVADSFQEKIKNTTLYGTRILVTSLLRTVNTIKKLKRINRNSFRISSHLHGTTFDLAHNEFVSRKSLSPAELDYLKEILAKTLMEFRIKKRCFVTYEIHQACFHVVNRKIYN